MNQSHQCAGLPSFAPVSSSTLAPSRFLEASEVQKSCNTCRLRRPLSEFPPHRRSRDGLRATCSPCLLSGLYRPRVETPQQRERRKVRHARPEWRRSHAEAAARWDALEPAKFAARMALRRALRHGRITKATQCQAAGCGETEKLHGHHPSYRKEHFLKVLWTCPKCHLRGHAAGFIPTASGVPRWLGQIPSVAVACTAEAGGRHARHH